MLRALLRGRLVYRVFLHGVVLLVVSAVAFLGIASVLLGDEPGASLATWFGEETCAAYAAAPGPAALAAFPIRAAILDATGAPLAAAPPEDRDLPRSERDVRGSPHVCADGSGRVVLLGPPRHAPSLSLLGVSVAAVVLLVALGSVPLARSIVKPLRELVATATRLGEGDLAARAPVDGAAELAELGASFNAMATKLAGRLRAEKEMLANVSHELRTPLARVRVVLETAEEDPARAASLLGEVARDLRELETLTRDVLASLEGERDGLAAGTLRLRPGLVDLVPLLRRVLARRAELEPERDVALEAPDALALEAADEALLRRLFDNLVDNACKYSSGAVTVRAEDLGDAVVVHVVDAGIGIAPADLPRVFEPFFRSDRSRQRATGGTGLGLALCERIATLHGGAISVRSVVDEGATFSVRLPRRR